MTPLLIKLLLAHSLGDFVLQPTHWVEDKQKNKHKSKYLYIHIGIHLLALLLLLGFDIKYIWAFIIIPISHIAIDLIKINFQTKTNTKRAFVLDQLAHLVVILLTVNYYDIIDFHFEWIYHKNTLLLLLALISVTYTSSTVMKLIMSQWKIEEGENISLKNAGKYIGILERLFVFGFIILNQWQAIGLLIAAKSVFRFGDLSKAKDRKLTEYILIGTILSFGLAISIGLLFNHYTK